MSIDDVRTLRVRVSGELQKFLARQHLSDDDQQLCLLMMILVARAGFVGLGESKIVSWLAYDSPYGERVFADVFFEPGRCRLLWKDIGSEETAQDLLHQLELQEVDAYFPFPPQVKI